MLRAYRLYCEWRERRIIGETLGDAIVRNGLREPDRYEGKVKVYSGKELIISRVICAEKSDHSSRRGNDEYVTAIMELAGGKIVEVDAKPCEVIEQ